MAASYLWVSSKTSLIHLATLIGLRDLVRQRLERDATEVDLKDGHHRTPLFYATLREQSDVVAYLLAHGADTNAIDLIGQRPLHIACTNGSKSIVASLLAARADLHALCSNNQTVGTEDDLGSLLDDDRLGEDGESRDGKENTTGTPLHFAAEYNHVGLTKLLLARNAYVNARDLNQRTALHRLVTSYNNNTEGVKLLLQSGIDKFSYDANGKTAHHLSARCLEYDSAEEPGSMRILLDSGFRSIILHNAQAYLPAVSQHFR